MALHNLEIAAARRNLTVDQLIAQALARHEGKVRPAASELGVSAEAIYRRLREPQREGERRTT